MATLHMETDVARQTQTTMVNMRQQIANEVQSMTNAVATLQNGAWQGNSAQEFYNVYQEWRTQANSLLQRLEELSQRLAREIEEWERVSSKLN
nr:WXG100 family type VII secretion target [Ardenticatena sp.]